ncbi:putative toxin-antitoxin system toxin component, PIN family [Thioalkalicoccus limnaeus]|uniref:Toxin-antitoxin system toxin component, PIN family n=1 Tax=Thioalkalicoccus limnaeus TaxID=120681 RepID=A0ABV4BKN9_9GAMM
MPALRVVLDTNVLLSGIAYPGSIPGKLVAAWRHGALEVVLSGYILDELRRVLPKLAHRHGLGADEIEDLIDALAIQAALVEPEAIDEPDLADAYDIPVLGTLIAALRTGQADWLITGDKALLSLSDRYQIRTPAEYWAAHGSV